MSDASTATPPIVETEDGGREQRWPLPADEQSLLDLINLCFEEYWDEIWLGWSPTRLTAPARVYGTVEPQSPHTSTPRHSALRAG